MSTDVERAALPTTDLVPTFVAHVARAQAELDAAVAEALATATVSAQDPSLLPGWTVGHVLTHLARHADATSRLLTGALVGAEPEQYVGGQAGRDAEIERGADRPLDVLAVDVRVSGARLAVVLHALPGDAWTGEQVWGAAPGTRFPVTRTLTSRWREIEIHRVDLGWGYTSADWPETFVEYLLPVELERLPERAPGIAVPTGLADHEVLAWLVGRGKPGLPELPAWA